MQEIFVIIALNLIFFFRTLRYRYAVDDWESARCHCKDPEYIDAEQTKGTLRIKVKVCKKCNILKRTDPKNIFQKFIWSFGGLAPVEELGGNIRTTQYTDPMFDHLITLALHIINCVLIYLALGQNSVSFLTAIFFSIHPVAMQGSSVWLSGKGYAAGLMFTLLAFWLAPFAPVFYWIGSFYISVLAMPMIFLKTAYWYWVFLIPIVFFLRRKNLKDAISFKYKMVSKTRNPLQWRNLILIPKTVGYYLSHCIFPTRLGIHHEYIQMHGVTPEETKESLSLKDWFFWLGLASIIGSAYMFFFRWGPVAFGVFWFMVFIAPWSNWIAAVNQQIGERYCVISLVGIMFAVANLVIDYPVAYVAMIVYYATITNNFMPAYHNVLDFAWYNVHNFPRSFQGWLWKSDLEKNFRLNERAFDSAMMAFMLRPDDFLVNNNLAAMLLQQRKYKEAEDFIKRMEVARLYNEGLDKQRKDRIAAMRAQIDEDLRQINKIIGKQERGSVYEA